MTDPSRYPDNGGTPRWVKVFGIIALVVALLLGYAQTLSGIAGVAADPTLADSDFVLLGTCSAPAAACCCWSWPRCWGWTSRVA